MSFANKMGGGFGPLFGKTFVFGALWCVFAASAAGQDPVVVPPVPPVPAATPPVVVPQPNPTGTPGVSEVPGLPVPALPDDPPPIAPNFEAPVRPLPAADRVGVDTADQMPMTLETAIEMALQNNNDIDASRNDVQISEFDLRAARGVYDPVFDSENFYERVTIPTASAIGGAVNGAVTQTRYFSSSQFGGFSPWMGGAYSARFDSSRTTTSNTNSFLNPQYPTLLSFSYVQPLLRNRSIDNNRRSIEIARRTLSLTDSQFRQRAIDVVALVEQSYWNLAFALRNLQVQLDAVRQARTQLESNQRLVAQGVLAPIDVVAASAQITTFEQNVYSAQEDVTRAENTLKTLVLPDRTDAMWARAITPVSPVVLDAPRVGLDAAMDDALRNRPEIAQLAASAEINQIDQEYFRNQTRPQIDLVGTYTSQGLAGTETAAAINPATGLSRVPPNLVGGYGTSIGNLVAQDYPTYRVGVTISLPWGNTIAKANLGRSLVTENRIRNVRAQTEQIIEAEVRNAIQALRSAEARLASALAARSASEQLAESEERQFRSGTTTFFLLLQRQTELLAARGRELQAQTDLNRAISELQRATGTTLSANNVNVSDGREMIIDSRGRQLAVRSRFFVRESK